MELLELLWNSYGTPIFLSLSLFKIDIYIYGVPGVPYSTYTHEIIDLIGELEFQRSLCVETSRKWNSWNSHQDNFRKSLYLNCLIGSFGVPVESIRSYRSSELPLFKEEKPRQEVFNAGLEFKRKQ